MTDRIYFLDHLKSLMIFLVIAYHSTFVYTSGLLQSWIVIDPVKLESLGLIGMYLDTFVMFVFFFVAGYFTPGSYRKFGTIDFLLRKVKRIIIPWFLAIITLIPLYKWLFLYSRGLPQEPWYSYFHVFQQIDAEIYSFNNYPTQSWLWFLPVLFLFYFAYVLIDLSGIRFRRSGYHQALWIFFAVSIVYLMVMYSMDQRGWYHSFLLDFQKERLLVYLGVFFLGALAYERQLFKGYQRKRRLFLFVNLFFAIGMTGFTLFSLNFFFNLIDPGRQIFYLSPWLDRLVYYLFFQVTMLGFLYLLLDGFCLYVNADASFWGLISRQSYGVYIIHMIVLGGVAWILVPCSLPTWLKFILVIMLTFVLAHLIVFFYQTVKRRLLCFP